MLRTTQRRMLRLIIQTKRKYKNKQESGGKYIRDDEISEETQEEISTHDECDQDSSISFDDDEESKAGYEDNLEDVKRSTKDADKKMLTHGIANWVEAQKKMKWRQAQRIVTQSKKRWTRKAAEWNPRLDKSTKTRRRAGRPTKR